MAKARKLSSGAWNCQAYVKNADGSISRPSFTASTKAEAERKAREFETRKKELSDVQNMTIERAIEIYLDVKEDVLSPSTFVDYQRKASMYYKGIEKTKIYDLTSSDLQRFVSDLYDGGRSTKSVKNIYRFMMAAIALQAPDLHFRVMFRAPDAQLHTLPTDSEVSLLLQEAEEPLRRAIILSAVGTLRRGECCAVKYSDLSTDLNCISVHADLVKDSYGTWIYKEHPKTGTSVRIVPLPSEAVASLGTGSPDDYIVGVMPDVITHRFCKLRKRLGIQFRFHDLRAYAASVMEYLGVPKSYIQATGGWRPGSMVLDQHYLRPMKDKQNTIIAMTSEYYRQNVLFDKSVNESVNEVSQMP